jgi:hypothetical protein
LARIDTRQCADKIIIHVRRALVGQLPFRFCVVFNPPVRCCVQFVESSGEVAGQFMDLAHVVR